MQAIFMENTCLLMEGIRDKGSKYKTLQKATAGKAQGQLVNPSQVSTCGVNKRGSTR